ENGASEGPSQVMAGPSGASVSDFGSGLRADLTLGVSFRLGVLVHIAVPRWYLWVVSRPRKVALSLTALLVVAACALIIGGLWLGIPAAVASVAAVGAAIIVPLITAKREALPPPVITAKPEVLAPPQLQVPDWVIDR